MTLPRSVVFALAVLVLTIVFFAVGGNSTPAQQAAGNGAQNPQASGNTGSPPALPTAVIQNVLLAGCVNNPAGESASWSVTWKIHISPNARYEADCPSASNYVSVWTADSAQKQFDYVRSEVKWELLKAVDDDLVQSKVIDNAISSNLMSRPDLQSLINAAVQKSSDNLEKKIDAKLTAMQGKLEQEIQAARHPATQRGSGSQ
jgi:hypothetical protein